MDDPRLFHADEFEVEPLEAVGEPLVVDAQQMQHRRVQIAHMNRVFGDIIGFSRLIGLRANATLIDGLDEGRGPFVGFTASAFPL